MTDDSSRECGGSVNQSSSMPNPDPSRAALADEREAKRTVWYVLAELRNPSPEPFAVLSADTTQREDGGIVSTVVSLHMLKEEADRIVHEFNNGPLS